MDHGPAAPMEEDRASEVKSRFGIKLFIIYAVIYFGFVLLNTLAPRIMSVKVIFGLNLAVVYGFGLILIAIILGLVYNAVCTHRENELNAEKGGPADDL